MMWMCCGQCASQEPQETFACLAAFACCGFVAAAIDIILGAELLLVVYGAENVRDVDLHGAVVYGSTGSRYME